MPYFLLSLAACFWGGNYVVGHELVTVTDPIILSTAHWILTALLLMLFYFRQVRPVASHEKSIQHHNLSCTVRPGAVSPAPLYRPAVHLFVERHHHPGTGYVHQ